MSDFPNFIRIKKNTDDKKSDVVKEEKKNVSTDNKYDEVEEATKRGKEKHLGLIKKRKTLTRILDRLKSIIRTFSWE